MKVGLLDCILGGYSLLQKPLMTPKERGLYKSLLLELGRRQPLEIFEYGSGFSTLYFAKFLRSQAIRFHIHSVDHDRAWHLNIQRAIEAAHLTKDVTLHLSPFLPGRCAPRTAGELDYIDMPRSLGVKFDLIVVDGRFRRRCLEVAASCLKTHGVIFLHDAERPFYHGPLSLFKYSVFIDGGHYYPLEPREHKVWLGSMVSAEDENFHHSKFFQRSSLMRRFYSDESFMKYFKNTGWLFFEKVLRVFVTLTVWALVIRYLGPQQFGVFSYALSYVFLFGMLADCGVDVVLVKELVEHPGRGAVVMGSAFVLRFLGAITACVLIVLSFFVVTIEPLTKVIIALMALRLFFAAFDNINSFFQSRVLSKYPVYAQLMSLVSTSILCVVFVFTHKPLVYFVWVVILEAAVAAAVFLFFYRRIHGDRWIFNAVVMGNLLSRSWPMVVSGFAVAIYMRLDQLMIKHMLGDAAVGQYAVAVRVSEAFYFIPMAVTASLFPAIVQAKMKGPQVYHDRLKALNALLIWIALPITAAFSLWGRGLIGFFFGSDYTPAAGVLMIHIWASVFVFLGVLRSKWAINEHVQNLVCAYTVLGAVINVVLNLIWIPAWGIQGAAFATVAAQCFAATLSNLLHPETRSMFFMQVQAFNPVCLMRKPW